MTQAKDFHTWVEVVRNAVDVIATRLRHDLSSAHHRSNSSSGPYEWVGEARDAAHGVLTEAEADTWPAYCAAVKDRLEEWRTAWHGDEWADPDGYGASALGDFMAELDRLAACDLGELLRRGDAVLPEAEPDTERAPVLPPQTSSGPALLGRWLVACIIDHGLLIGVLLVLLASGPDPVAHLIVTFLILLVFQPLLEAVGGTPGQWLTGVRLLAPGTCDTPSLWVIVKRHAYRMGLLWGVAHAVGLWIALARATPEGRLFLAGDRASAFDWIFIDR